MFINFHLRNPCWNIQYDRKLFLLFNCKNFFLLQNMFPNFLPRISNFHHRNANCALVMHIYALILQIVEHQNDCTSFIHKLASRLVPYQSSKFIYRHRYESKHLLATKMIKYLILFPSISYQNDFVNPNPFIVFQDDDTSTANANIELRLLNDSDNVFQETCTKLQSNHTSRESTVFFCSKFCRWIFFSNLKKIILTLKLENVDFY